MENSVSLLQKGTVGQYDIQCLAVSPIVVTFIHHKGRPRWMSRLEAYACKRGNSDVVYC